MKKLSQQTQTVLTNIFAQLFDTFKQSHPIIAGGITTVLAILNIAATFGVEAGFINIIPGTLTANAIYGITLGWGFLNSSRTTSFLATAKQGSWDQVRIDPAAGIEPILVSAPAPQVHTETSVQNGSIQDVLNKQRIGQR